MLFLLLTAQRGQTLHLICVEDVNITENQMVIYTDHLLKQSRPKYHLPDIQLDSYPADLRICIVHIFQVYLDRTKELRQNTNKLLIQTQKPHGPVSRDTVARWIKTCLTKAGVKSTFRAHSTRTATTSAAKLKGVPLEEIMRSAGWTNAQTFGKFYHKVVQHKGIQSIIQA